MSLLRAAGRSCVGAVALLLMLGGGGVSSASAATTKAPVQVERLGGEDRYATAAAIAKRAFPSQATTANIVRGDTFPDALSTANISGPILLSKFDQLPEATRTALPALGASQVNFMGSHELFSAGVYDQLQGAGYVLSRIGGADRYETNFAAYARTYNAEGTFPRRIDGLGTAFLVSGVSFPDALAAGPVAQAEEIPLLMTAPDKLSDTVVEALPYAAGGIQRIIVVGGPQAVSPAVVSDLESRGIIVERIAGATRQETAVEVYDFAHEKFEWTPQAVTLARGDDFADALAALPYAARYKFPILLTGDPQHLSPSTEAFFAAHNDEITFVTVLGDDPAVSDAVVTQALNAS